MVAAGYSFTRLAPPPLLSITRERKNLTRRRRRIFQVPVIVLAVPFHHYFDVVTVSTVALAEPIAPSLQHRLRTPVTILEPTEHALIFRRRRRR